MKRNLLKILEKAFIAEVNDALPVQFGRRHPSDIAHLVAEGYLQPMKMTLGGRFPVEVSGYQLTHLGRITYCETC